MGCCQSEVLEPHGLTLEDVPEEHRALIELFLKWDVDGNGTIDILEIKEATVRLGLNLSEDDCEHLLKMCDADGDGKIDYHEFANLVKETMNEKRKSIMNTESPILKAEN